MKNRLIRTLNTRDSFLIISGNMIGIGIFTTTGYISTYVSSSGGMLLLWILGGVLAFCGALTYAELASHFPRAGGDFHYLSAAFHPFLGFLFGWSAFSVTYTGSIAVIAVGFASYFLNLFPENVGQFQLIIPWIGLTVSSLKLIAIGITFLFTLFNVRGIRTGARWQTFLTTVSILVLLAFIFLGITSPKGSWNHFKPFLPSDFQFSTISRYGVALVGIFFTYSGWTTIVYIAGEVREPQKTIPQAMWLSVVVVMILYILVNIVYIFALPLRGMVNVVDIGYRSLLQLRGEGWSLFFIFMILIAVLSTLNSTILSGARIYYAMARSGQFFAAAGKLHPKTHCPVNALWLQFAWTVILILSGSFNQLLTYTVFVMVCFGFLSGASLFLFRKKISRNSTFFRAWGYPFTTLLYLAISAWIMYDTLRARYLESLLGIALVLLGIPLYIYFHARKKRTL
ncbi:MAG: amino acid permease [Calditrichia bacterium]